MGALAKELISLPAQLWSASGLAGRGKLLEADVLEFTVLVVNQSDKVPVRESQEQSL